MIDIAYLKKNDLILFECISGSKAYGLATPESDTDIKGVYILPEEIFYGFDIIEQVNNETNDIVYYELKKFLFLLGKNNPNIMEMLNTPADCILHKHDLFDQITPSLFISGLCKDTFANYAMSQVKRARGLNKKIMNPMAKEKKGVLDFCYVTHQGKTLEVKKWLIHNEYRQEECGLVNLNHFKDCYALYHSADHHFSGIIKKETSSDVCVSSVPKELPPAAYLYFNRDGYSRYVKDYAEYWNWVNNRNEARYQSTIKHGKNYDAKNLMHTFRLLAMAEEIATTGMFNVKRPDRDFLLNIKNGSYTYDDLVTMAEERIKKIDRLYEKAHLPAVPDGAAINDLLVKIRREFYKTR